MPINNWNWYRAVGTGGDHKAWIGDNPQVRRTAKISVQKLS